MILTFDDESIFRKCRFRRKDIMTIADNIERAIAISDRIDFLN